VAHRPRAPPEPRDEERRQRAQRLSSRPLPQLKPETMFPRHRRSPHLWSTTIRNCLFTLFRIEDLEIAQVGSSVPACSATMYAAYQSGQFSSR